MLHNQYDTQIPIRAALTRLHSGNNTQLKLILLPSFFPLKVSLLMFTFISVSFYPHLFVVLDRNKDISRDEKAAGVQGLHPAENINIGVVCCL